jgi:hypothetical protein
LACPEAGLFRFCPKMSKLTTHWQTLLLVMLKSRNISTPTRRLVLFDSLFDHPAVEISPDLDYDAILIESHAPGICVIKLKA